MKLPERSGWFIQLLICMFPLVTAGVRDGGSAVFILLMVVGLVYGWPAWRGLLAWEKSVLIGFMVFFAIMLLSMINTQDLPAAIRKLERFLRLLGVIPIYLLLRRSAVTGGPALLLGSALGCLLLAAEAWYQVNITKTNPWATGAYHKIILGDTAVLLCAYLSIGMVMFARCWWHYILFGICIAAGLYASAMSMTRAAWLFIPVAAILWMWLYRDRLNRQTWLKIASGFSLLLIVGFIWQPQSIVSGVRSGVADLRNYSADPNLSSSWGLRINMWRDALTIFKEHPVLGSGIGDYEYDRRQLMENGEARRLTEYAHAHSIYFHALATTGIVGTLALLWALFVRPWRAFYQHWNLAREPWLRFYIVAGLSTTVAFAVFGLGEGWLSRNPFVNDYTFFTILLLSGVANILHPLNLNKSVET